MSPRYITGLLCILVGAAGTGAALAQSAAELNPAVNTSEAQPAPASAAAPEVDRPSGQDLAGQDLAGRRAVPPAPVPGPLPSSEASRTAHSSRPSQAARAELAGAAAPTARRSSSAPPAATPGAAGSGDRIELGTTQISGNRELPKVLYVVPWRRPEIGDAVGRPPNSLVEEALTPVDRAVFRRQNRYYAALEAGAAQGKSQPAAAGAAAPRAAPKDER